MGWGRYWITHKVIADIESAQVNGSGVTWDYVICQINLLVPQAIVLIYLLALKRTTSLTPKHLSVLFLTGDWGYFHLNFVWAYLFRLSSSKFPSWMFFIRIDVVLNQLRTSMIALSNCTEYLEANSQHMRNALGTIDEHIYQLWEKQDWFMLKEIL